MTSQGRALLLALGLAGVATGGGCSADEHATEPAVSDAPAPPRVQTVSQAVQTQPVAKPKLLRVAPEHVQAVQRGLAQRLTHSGDGLQIDSHPHGKRVKLEGRYGHVLIANQDEAGQTQVKCAGSPEEVAKAMGN